MNPALLAAFLRGLCRGIAPAPRRALPARTPAPAPVERIACERCEGVVVCAPGCNGKHAAARADFGPFAVVDGRALRRLPPTEPETMDALKTETPDGCCIGCDEPLSRFARGRICRDPECQRLIQSLRILSARSRKEAA